jgi:hypothetical protein
MLAPDARTLRTCVTDGRPDGSLLHPIVFGGSGNDCFHLLAPVSHRHVCNSAVEHSLFLRSSKRWSAGSRANRFQSTIMSNLSFNRVSLAARFPRQPRSLLSTAQAPPARRLGPVRCRDPGPGPVSYTKETLKKRLRHNAILEFRQCDPSPQPRCRAGGYFFQCGQQRH